MALRPGFPVLPAGLEFDLVLLGIVALRSFNYQQAFVLVVTVDGSLAMESLTCSKGKVEHRNEMKAVRTHLDNTMRLCGRLGERKALR